ncbi:MAG: hypothetical protein JXC85_02010 [Candidatus Aenigmarchaeota archaeon]|nr:hypothetical protein [Candidatus Aenigmarchaeota archaeon]
MAKAKARIHKDTTLSEVLSIRGSAEVLEKHKTPCLHCPMAAYEMGTLTIGEIAKAYGIDAEKLLHDLNDKNKAKR